MLPVSEYLKMIIDEEGNVRRRLFFDNIRDFQGDTPVNISIASTLTSGSSIEFPLRNNGVTIMTRKLQRVGAQFTLEDFQIVNGCQTSHVIAANATPENQGTMIPIKIVATEDEEVTRQVIIASNQQNKVDQESFWALDPIHKSIEIYFESKGQVTSVFTMNAGQGSSKQCPGSRKFGGYKGPFAEGLCVRLPGAVEPVGRYYKDPTPLIGKEIFSPEHDVHSHYTAALSAFRLEFLFRKRRLDTEWKPFRFQIVLAARLIIEREQKLDSKSKRSQAYCTAIDTIMLDPDRARRPFSKEPPRRSRRPSQN